MKALIWVLCSLGFAIITTILAGLGLILGGIPMALLAFGAFALARYLCRQWDNRKTEGREDESSTSTVPSSTDAEAALTIPPSEEIPAELPIEESSAENPMEELSADPAPDTKHTDTPPAPASNQTDYKAPFIATAITAAVLAFIAILAVISASYMYSEADMKSAYSRAYNSGYEVGLQSGQEAGFQSGYDAGYNDGFAAPRKLARPMSGTIFSGKEYTGSTLTVRASYSDDYVISVKNSAGRPLTVFYVRAGETVTVNVPDIKLRIYFAKGDDWYGYGEGLMFGEKTVYSRGDDLYDFSKYTWTFTLSPVYNGNFDETFVSEDDFF